MSINRVDMCTRTPLFESQECIGRLLTSGRGVGEQHSQAPSILIARAGLKEGNFISRKIIHARWANDDNDVHLDTLSDEHASRTLPLTDSATGGRRKVTLQNHAWMTTNTHQNHNKLIQNHLQFIVYPSPPPILHYPTISSPPFTSPHRLSSTIFSQKAIAIPTQAMHAVRLTPQLLPLNSQFSSISSFHTLSLPRTY